MKSCTRNKRIDPEQSGLSAAAYRFHRNARGYVVKCLLIYASACAAVAASVAVAARHRQPFQHQSDRLV